LSTGNHRKTHQPRRTDKKSRDSPTTASAKPDNRKAQQKLRHRDSLEAACQSIELHPRTG